MDNTIPLASGEDRKAQINVLMERAHQDLDYHASCIKQNRSRHSITNHIANLNLAWSRVQHYAQLLENE